MSALSGTFPLTPNPQLARRLNLRSLRVAVLLLAVAVLNAIDLNYTLFANHIGVLHEMNPLTAPLIEAGLIRTVIVFKILMVACGLGVLWKLRHSRLAIPACWLLLVAYVWLGFVWVEWVQTIDGILDAHIAAASAF